MDSALLYPLNGLLAAPGGAVWVWAGTHPASLIFIAAAAIWVAAWPDLRTWILPAALAAIVANATVAHVWKPIFDRPRPCAEDPALLTDIPGAPPHCGQDNAFPSGHAATTAAIAIATMSQPLMAVSVFIGVERVVVAAHHPSDVAVGWMYGGMIGWLARWAWSRRPKKRVG